MSAAPVVFRNCRRLKLFEFLFFIGSRQLCDCFIVRVIWFNYPKPRALKSYFSWQRMAKTKNILHAGSGFSKITSG
jgi:hypothetical protein